MAMMLHLRTRRTPRYSRSRNGSSATIGSADMGVDCSCSPDGRHGPVDPNAEPSTELQQVANCIHCSTISSVPIRGGDCLECLRGVGPHALPVHLAGGRPGER